MTALTDILSALEPIDGGFRGEIPADWLQGRTAYGGLSSALALHAALACEPDLPPLRSALVAFIGPLAGTVTITARKLRRGRNAAYIEAAIESDAGVGYRATFVFMREMESAISFDRTQSARLGPPAGTARVHRGPANHFTANFEFLDCAAPDTAGEWHRWARLVHRDGLDPEVALIAIADALPPAAYQLHRGAAAMSSLTWQLNLLVPRPTTTDGWWLIQSRTDRAVGGYSSQRMTMWSADGTAIADAMQGVAIFT